MPVLEAASLQVDLRRADIELWAWIANQSLAAAHPASQLLMRRAEQAWMQLGALRMLVDPAQSRHDLGEKVRL